jgi:phosphoenolpyruvate carboxylase
MSAVWGIMGAGYRPITQASQVKYEKAITKLNEFLEKFNPFFQEDIKNFRKLLSESDFSLLKTYELLKIKEEKEA